MTDFSVFKVNLKTQQSTDNKGEPARSVATQYNNFLDAVGEKLETMTNGLDGTFAAVEEMSAEVKGLSTWVSLYRWDFDFGKESWTVSSTSQLEIQWNPEGYIFGILSSGFPRLRTPYNMLAFDPKIFSRIKARFRWARDDIAGNFNWQVRDENSATFNIYPVAPYKPNTTEWQEIEFDVSGTSIESIAAITSFSQASATHDLDWVEVGGYRIASPTTTFHPTVTTPTVFVRDFLQPNLSDANQTAAVRMAHARANMLGLPVSYAGIPEITVDQNAQVNLHTDVDFAGCIFNLVAESPSGLSTLFFVEGNPLVTVTADLDPAYAKEGSIRPTYGVFDGPGWASVNSSKQINPRRTTDTETVNYQQSFYICMGGEASAPLSVDLSAHTLGCTIRYRLDESSRRRLTNFTLREGDWGLPANNSSYRRIFRITRNQVDLDFSLIPGSGATTDSVDRLIDVASCADLNLKARLVGRPTSQNQGTYGISLNSVARLVLQATGANTTVSGSGHSWGVLGTNHLNDIFVEKSVLNRFDVHAGAHNISMVDSRFTRNGVQFGWGGGTIKLTRCYAYNSNLVQGRVDYGGGIMYGHGAVVLENCHLHQDSTTRDACAIEFTRLRAQIIDVIVPSIHISNLLISGTSPRYHVIKAATPEQQGAAILPPKYVDVIAVRVLNPVHSASVARVRKIQIPYNIFSASDYVPQLNVSNYRGPNYFDIAIGNDTLADAALPVDKLELKVRDSSYYRLTLLGKVGVALHETTDSDFGYVIQSGFTGTVSEQQIRSCRLLGLGSTKRVVTVGANSHINGCFGQTGANLDVSGAASIVGTVMPASLISYPAGVTRALCMSGWIRDM